MPDIAAKYKIPDDLMAFVNDGFLAVLSEDEATKTIEFHIPSRRWTDRSGRVNAYSVTWIHPDFNADFCHYYDEKPGDNPNFYVELDTCDVGSDLIDGLKSVDDLVWWLDEIQGTFADGCRAASR